MTENNHQLKVIGEGILGAVAIAGTVLLSPLLRPWYKGWGTTGDETRRPLPGDEFVSNPKSEYTCAVTVKAPIKRVWPWFVQLGCQRAGWYSYDLLDNGGRHSAEQIIPKFQTLKTGDTVRAMPKGDFGFPVAVIQPGKVLALCGTLNTQTGQPANPKDPNLAAYFSGAQIFYLEKVDQKTTRLFFRMRTDWNPKFLNTLAYRVFLEPISFVMSRKMLLGVKARAERKQYSG